MAWLELNKLKYSIMDRILLDLDYLTIESDEKIGLVGINGSGKTTLLNIIKGTVYPDTGTVKRKKSISLLPQLKKSNGIKSGGEVTASTIISVLNEKSGILLADEPTTHLDVEHIEWLEKEIIAYNGAYIIVSHDRDFLDKTCNQIWELNDGKIKQYSGNYTAYTTEKEKELKQRQNSYNSYKKKEKQLLVSKRKKEQQAQRAISRPENISGSEARIAGARPYFEKKAKKLHKAASSMDTRIDQLEKVEKPEEPEIIKMKLTNERKFLNRYIIRANDFSMAFPKKTLWNSVNFSIKGGEKVAILGKNGSGKTTLIRKMLTESNGIRTAEAMKIGYFAQNLSVLDEGKTILENVQNGSKQTETLIRIILAQLLFKKEDVYKQVDVLSGGERVKVALAKLIAGDYNTLILDEPTNFLDTQAIESLEALLSEYEGSVLFVTHDRRFLNKIANRLLVIEDKQIHSFTGSYEEYKTFKNKPKQTSKEEELIRIENKLVTVLSKLSIEPSDELEEEFQQLLKQKKKLKMRD
ncbi:ribosomal protection-like ABC-F family protein [Marinilactibacillus psychrotolerans]|uniref:ribosomal protection-like ABC-F family protein n=1 Tax=Marinilactibacillus psychrotolerans TaxID=191770 RepID=UPI003886CF73